MRSLVIAVLLFALLGLSVGAQATPSASTAADNSDGLFAGNFIENLGECAEPDVCIVSFAQGGRGDEYFWGVLHNNTDSAIDIDSVSVAIYDSSGELAAAGDSFNVSPSVVGPSGHAVVGVTMAGEFVEDFTYEATVDYAPADTEDVNGIPVQVASARVRGDGILGEVVNTGATAFTSVSVAAYCLNDDGGIFYRGTIDVEDLNPGDSAPFSAPIYDYDCTNFIVIATGRS